VTFLVFGIVFWIPVVDSPPLHARLDDLRSALYVVGGAATGWILALVLAFAPRPLYPAYAALPHRLGGISAVGDQQIAAGVMLGIGSIPFTIAMFVYLYRWLDDGRRSEAVPQSPARLDRSSQTDARAKPARREIGTASGA
jgi:cytochrome c oxidase assembly factor CtaG